MPTRFLIAAAFVLTIVVMAYAPPATPPLERRQQGYEVCQPCHGENGEGLQALNAPRLAGQHDWYLKRQLQNFKAGLRGTHADDMYGQQMAAMAATLTNEQAIDEVVAYIGTLEAPAPARTQEGGDATKGQTLFGTCLACHGATGEGNKALNAPRLAGQYDWYLSRQLQNFKAGIRGASQNDPHGAMMRTMANTLPDEQAILDVVAYIQGL